MLIYYDSDQNPFGSNPLTGFANGHLGEIVERKFYLRNNDSAKFYTNVTVETVVPYEVSESAYSTKLMYGDRRPTDTEWSFITPSQRLALPDIGNSAIADISTYHPVWVRFYVPGGEPSQYNTNFSIKVTAREHPVGP